MRWMVVSFLALCACGSDVDVRTVVYDSRHSSGAMDIFVPAGASATPAVLFVHGGGWWYGDRSKDLGPAEQLAGAGYVTATTDYRLVPDGRFPGAVHDVFCALSYLRAHAAELGIDPQRVAVAGYSAGGHLVGMLGVAADVGAVQDEGCESGRTGPAAAVIAGAMPADLTVLDDDTTTDFVGVPFDEDPDRWRLASPAYHVGPGEPPFLLIHAEHDLIVDIEQSETMLAALRSSGNDAALLRIEGGGHGIGDGPGLGYERLEVAFDTPEAVLAIVDFLARTVGTP